MGIPSDKELKKLVKQLLREGWTLETSRKHTKLRSPKGHLVSMSSSPSCPYAFKNVARDVQKIIEREVNESPVSQCT